MKVKKIILKIEDGKDIEFTPVNGVRVALARGVSQDGDDMGFCSYKDNGKRSIVIMDVPPIINEHLDLKISQISELLND